MRTSQEQELRDDVRRTYANAARDARGGKAACDCGRSGACSHVTGQEGNAKALYDRDELAALPATSVLASLGCGNPIAVAELREGDVVLDLGSGGGIDVILSAKRVGPTGTAFGLDMTDEMLSLAERSAAEAGVRNVRFLKGYIEAIPLPSSSVDVVISNCVVNLSADKPAVLREMARVLRPGGRVGISDIVAENRLTPEERADRGSVIGCLAGALSRSEYLSGLLNAGFEEMTVEFTHEVADGMHGAIVTASKPRAAEFSGHDAGATPAGELSVPSSEVSLAPRVRASLG